MSTYQEMIAEVRESRVRMSEKCGHDVERLLDYLLSFEMKHAKQVSSNSPAVQLPYGRRRRRPASNEGAIDAYRGSCRRLRRGRADGLSSSTEIECHNRRC